MTDEPSEPVRAAMRLVFGLGALGLAYVLTAPLVHYAAVGACGVLLGIALWSLAGALSRRLRFSYRLALAAVLAAVLAALVGFSAWAGPQFVEELDELRNAVPQGVARAREWLEQSAIGRSVLSRITSMDEAGSASAGQFVGRLQRGVSSGLGVVADSLIVVLLGLFFAASPGRYVDGLLALAPPSRRPRLREVVRTIVETLRTWLAARLVLMAVIGTAFAIGLALLGVPLALPIGVLAGALAFIPYVGAVLALVPALAVSFLIGPTKALQVLALYLAIQFVETNVLDPIVESRAVKLPPALVVIGQVVTVVYFGPVGVLIATPLLVIVVLAIRMLYIEAVLGEAPPVRAPRRPLWFRRQREA